MTRDEFEQLVRAAKHTEPDGSIRFEDYCAAHDAVMAAWDAREKEARDALDAATRDMEEARSRMEVMRAALEDFAEHGTRRPENPTHWCDSKEDIATFFNAYIKDMNRYVRESARRALGRE